jgi:hypothetical protein
MSDWLWTYWQWLLGPAPTWIVLLGLIAVVMKVERVRDILDVHRWTNRNPE